MSDGALPGSYFDRMYAAADDPWGFTERWYERRKYALTLAALPRERYRSAFEAGCSIGVFTAALAPRCGRLLASDVAGAAVTAAVARTADLPQVTVDRRVLPRDWPTGPFDLVVLAEVGYYFDAPTLADLLTRAVDSLEPGGTLLAVHWRHPVADYPQPGDAVHAALAGEPGLARTVNHVEADFRLEVYARTPPPARSVAAETGLA